MVFRALLLLAIAFPSFAAEVAGEDFYRALLRIWLGERPVQADLRKALLGEKQ